MEKFEDTFVVVVLEVLCVYKTNYVYLPRQIWYNNKRARCNGWYSNLTRILFVYYLVK